MVSYILKGGFMMWPLLACSIISVAITIDRLLFFYRISIDEKQLMSELKSAVKNHNLKNAMSVCNRHPGPVARIMLVIVENFSQDKGEIERIIERESINEIPAAEKYIMGLAIIASISTLMGFTGTVTGMIRAFADIASRGVSSPSVVASGISEALITTATGLIIAIPTIVFYHYFNYRVGRLTLEIAKCSNELLELKS